MDRDYIRKAMDAADLNAVRMALYQNTGDPALAALPQAQNMSDEQRNSLKQQAVDWLEANASTTRLPEPDDAELRKLMSMATAEDLGQLEFEARREQTAFKDYPFLVQWDGDKPEIPSDFRVVIVGSGFSGVVMAVQCQLLGIPYVVIEKGDEPGGTWNINRYPDVRVDTISLTYELSFEKDWRWKEYFGRGEEVREYLNHVSRKFGVYDNTRFGHALTRASFDEASGKWLLDVDTPDGPERMEASVLVTATGLFANPKIVEFEGRDLFRGQIVHPARWPEDLSLKGKRVAVIGNGSTGIQMVGAIAEQAEHTCVFQRTPQWIAPRDKYGQPMEPEVHWLMDNFPGYWNWARYMAGAPLFDTHALVCTDPEWQAKGGKVNPVSDAMRGDLAAYIERETGGDRSIIDRVLPDYAPMSRRPVVDNGWYRALTRDDCELVTDPIARFSENGIVTADGTEHPLDVVVTATGFEVVKYLWPAQFYGRGGLEVHDMWEAADGPRAWIGAMVPGFPNMFMLYGPNSQPVSSGPAQSTWFTIWSAFIGRCLMKMLREGASTIEVTREAYEAYNKALDVESRNLVAMTKEGGIEKNYYVNNEHGRLQVNSPWYGPVFQKMFAEPDWDAVELRKESQPAT
ncbi:MAG: NAD(P)-binding domain-containing protein [Novosphingobium sp.]|nr:NAD(P)-binding domain-containing protein [Novosphingobium sp.]